MTDKDLCIETEEIQTDGKDTYYCHRYEPTPYEVLDELFTFYTPEKTDVFVDYGCGMGRLNFYIEKRYSLSSTGVEYSPVYYKKALENKKTYNGNKDIALALVHRIQVAAQFLLGQFRLLGMYQDNRPPD